MDNSPKNEFFTENLNDKSKHGFTFQAQKKYSISKQCWYLDQNFERRTTICFWQNYTNTFWNFVFFEVSCISFANLNKHFYILNSKFFLKKFHRNDFIWSLTKELICIENDWPIRSIQHFCWNLFHFAADLSGKLIENVETVWSIRSNQHNFFSFICSKNFDRFDQN